MAERPVPPVTQDPFRYMEQGGWRFDEVTARCRSCKTEIIWGVSPGGRRAPYDLDGTSHFATCPQAGYWRGSR